MKDVLSDLKKVVPPPGSDTGDAGTPLTKQLKLLVQKRSKPEKALLLALALIPVIMALFLLLFILQKPQNSVQLLRDVELTAHWEDRNLEGDHPKGYPPSLLLDNDLSTAWLLPIGAAKTNPILVIRFPKTTIVTALGFAIGYQRSLDDNFQDRFTVFNKPKELVVRTRTGQSQKLLLQNIKGVQFPDFTPIETDELLIDLKEIYQTDPAADLAISELRILGLPVK
jgi:hypothetical protein